MPQAPDTLAYALTLPYALPISNLTGGVVTGYYNIYLRNWQAGTPSTTLMTPNAAGTDGGNGESVHVFTSADGCTGAFISSCTNFTGGASNNNHQVYIKPVAGTL